MKPVSSALVRQRGGEVGREDHLSACAPRLPRLPSRMRDSRRRTSTLWSAAEEWVRAPAVWCSIWDFQVSSRLALPWLVAALWSAWALRHRSWQTGWPNTSWVSTGTGVTRGAPSGGYAKVGTWDKSSRTPTGRTPTRTPTWRLCTPATCVTTAPRLSRWPR